MSENIVNVSIDSAIWNPNPSKRMIAGVFQMLMTNKKLKNDQLFQIADILSRNVH